MDYHQLDVDIHGAVQQLVEAEVARVLDVIERGCDLYYTTGLGGRIGLLPKTNERIRAVRRAILKLDAYRLAYGDLPAEFLPGDLGTTESGFPVPYGVPVTD